MMKSLFLSLCVLCLVSLTTCALNAPAFAQSPRHRLNFNRDWKFQLGDHPGAEARRYDDSNWDSVGLPHSFSIPYFLSPHFYTGYGWYRKHFSVPTDWNGKRLFLEFDGAFQDAEVFVNEKKVGRHRGGYTGFSLDITDAAKRGDNVVAVRLNNNWDAQLAPRAGEHTFSGGLYRDVHLVVTDRLHVTWYGTFVTTPQVSKTSATVNIKTEVRNDSASAQQCVLKTEIFDPNGHRVAATATSQSIAAGGMATFDQASAPILNPQLWHPDHPSLYRAVTSIARGKALVDRYETTFGMRWFAWTADKGFFLNDEHFYIKGANAHQDHAGWGDAVTNAGFERDVKLIKDAGFDFIRGSHYPHDSDYLDACDQQGVLFWSENCFWGTGSFKSPWGGSAYPPEFSNQAPFEESVEQSLREMIRIHRNHPSIVAWSMDNEVFFTEKSTLPKVRDLLERLAAIAQDLDPTRPAAIGGAQRGEIDKLGDLAGYNGDGARLFINPGIPNIVSEYGSTIADRPGKYEPGWGDLPKADQDKTLTYPWRYPWRSGEVLWCAFDHGSLGGRFGWMGMVDYFRLPKRQWYWYRSEYKHIPPPEWPQNGIPAGLRLTADKTALAANDGTDDTQLIATVIDKDGKALSNCPPVTLTIVSGPGEFPTGPSITFEPNSDIAIRDGQAAIEFRSYYGGKSVIRATSPGLRDATITITTMGEPRFVPGKTQGAQPRPYTRYEGPAAAVPPTVAATVYGLQNPTSVSSEAPAHSARFGNDGDLTTFWQAGNAANTAWWQVDLERLMSITGTKLTFPSNGNYRYKIDASEDGRVWTSLIDQTATVSTEKVRTDTRTKPVSGRYLRVTFADTSDTLPAALSDIAVFGSILTQ